MLTYIAFLKLTQGTHTCQVLQLPFFNFAALHKVSFSCHPPKDLHRFHNTDTGCQ